MMNLPTNCSLEYIPGFLTEQETIDLYRTFVSIHQIQDCKLKLGGGKEGELIYSDFGKIMALDKRLIDSGTFPEEIWGRTIEWADNLWSVKKRVQELTGRIFGVGVCIYYPDGNSGIGYHSDPPAFGDTTVIPSLSLGEERLFLLREIETGKEYKIILESGSLLVMGEYTQTRYEHSLPVDSRYKNGRINITFRQYGFNN